MKLFRSLFLFLFFHFPRIAFQVAGLIRAVNRGKRTFGKSLKREGLPEEVVEELVREFDPLVDVSFKGLLNLPWKHGRR